MNVEDSTLKNGDGADDGDSEGECVGIMKSSFTSSHFVQNLDSGRPWLISFSHLLGRGVPLSGCSVGLSVGVELESI